LVEANRVAPNFVAPNLVAPSFVAPNFVDANWLTPGLVTMAFCVAMRLLISDFFSMDICLLLFLDCQLMSGCIAQGLPNSSGLSST